MVFPILSPTASFSQLTKIFDENKKCYFFTKNGRVYLDTLTPWLGERFGIIGRVVGRALRCLATFLLWCSYDLKRIGRAPNNNNVIPIIRELGVDLIDKVFSANSFGVDLSKEEKVVDRIETIFRKEYRFPAHKLRNAIADIRAIQKHDVKPADMPVEWSSLARAIDLLQQVGLRNKALYRLQDYYYDYLILRDGKILKSDLFFSHNPGLLQRVEDALRSGPSRGHKMVDLYKRIQTMVDLYKRIQTTDQKALDALHIDLHLAARNAFRMSLENDLPWFSWARELLKNGISQMYLSIDSFAKDLPTEWSDVGKVLEMLRDATCVADVQSAHGKGYLAPYRDELRQLLDLFTSKEDLEVKTCAKFADLEKCRRVTAWVQWQKDLMKSWLSHLIHERCQELVVRRSFSEDVDFVKLEEDRRQLDAKLESMHREISQQQLIHEKANFPVPMEIDWMLELITMRRERIQRELGYLEAYNRENSTLAELNTNMGELYAHLLDDLPKEWKDVDRVVLRLQSLLRVAEFSQEEWKDVDRVVLRLQSLLRVAEFSPDRVPEDFRVDAESLLDALKSPDCVAWMVGRLVELNDAEMTPWVQWQRTFLESGLSNYIQQVLNQVNPEQPDLKEEDVEVFRRETEANLKKVRDLIRELDKIKPPVPEEQKDDVEKDGQGEQESALSNEADVTIRLRGVLGRAKAHFQKVISHINRFLAGEEGLDLLSARRKPSEFLFTSQKKRRTAAANIGVEEEESDH